jgi:uncharacterized membrane protein YjjP (DUF1212 family)
MISLSPAPATATPAKLSPQELFDYLLELGGTLLSYGCPTHRLEAVVRELAALEGYEAQAFAVPTGLFLSVRGPGLESGMLRLVRVKEWAVDLQKLALVDRIFNDVLERRTGISEARARLDEVEASRRPYSPTMTWLAAGATAGATAIFFRGGLPEVTVAAVGGALLGFVFALLGRRAGTRHLQEFIGGLIAGGLALGATTLWPIMSREVLVLSIVILLVPGMALTVGLSELAHKNLVSGAARLMDAMIVFLSILFGIACVIALEQLLALPQYEALPRDEPGLLAQGLAMLVAGAGFCVLFAVPRRFLHLGMLSGVIGWVVTGLGIRHLPGSLSAFLAALAVSLYANGVARTLGRPAQVFQLPGLVLLVPGSFGFLSLEAMLRGEFLGGTAKAFEMFLVGAAIVTGLLVANVVLPARKLL